ncbi:hypothetical protein CEXT_702091 [Caerostris extrusa]|uniref:Uncharacterized protein n=1 Tax=Caerostris extrusa TaxID=172846 RepID=A0AAV4Y4T1_CAEEX|nr:hypothetical protein CEXT_702091 [Caerostris extrusa]
MHESLRKIPFQTMFSTNRFSIFYFLLSVTRKEVKKKKKSPDSHSFHNSTEKKHISGICQQKSQMLPRVSKADGEKGRGIPPVRLVHRGRAHFEKERRHWNDRPNKVCGW